MYSKGEVDNDHTPVAYHNGLLRVVGLKGLNQKDRLLNLSHHILLTLSVHIWRRERERDQRSNSNFLRCLWGGRGEKNVHIFVVQICCKNASNCFKFISISVRNQIRHEPQQTRGTKKGQAGKSAQWSDDRQRYNKHSLDCHASKPVTKNESCENRLIYR